MKPSLLDRVTIEVGKCGGRPCIRGLRIRVTDILGLLGAGASHQEILEDYPFLEENDILVSLEYAAGPTGIAWLSGGRHRTGGLGAFHEERVHHRQPQQGCAAPAGRGKT